MTAKTRLAGVAGWPIAHSLSPLLHTYWLRQYGLTGAYVPLAIRREDFSIAVAGLRHAGFVGLNVTIPHKEAAFALAQDLDEPARMTGSANLLCFPDKSTIVGRNTDVAGLVASLVEEFGRDVVRGKAAIVLGAGGGARAATLALAELGATEICIVARNAVKIDALIVQLKPHVEASLIAYAWINWSQALPDAALLVNATPAGMIGKPPIDLSLDMLPKNAAVCDLVYNPLETDLVRHARARGLPAMNGLRMLMHQAVPAFTAFFGVTPKVTPALHEMLEKVMRS